MTIAVEEICKTADGSFRWGLPLPQAMVEEARSGRTNDVVCLMKNGKEWAFEFIAQFQPRTHRLLMDGGDFTIAYNSSFAARYMAHVFMEVQGQAIEIVRERYGFNASDDTFPIKSYAGERVSGLPEPIRMAYYHRIDGMGIPHSVGMGPFTKILPYPVSRPWQSIDGYLNDLRLKKKLLPVVEEMLPCIRPEGKVYSNTNFMMFLNSWGSFIGKKRTDGDHLFIKTEIPDGVVYYIRDADVANMMILADPAEAIDRYCEHVLLRKEERFDFRPWAVPFEAPKLTNPPQSNP